MKSNVSTTYRQNVHDRFTFEELEHFSCHDNKLFYRASGIVEISTKKYFNRDPLHSKISHQHPEDIFKVMLIIFLRKQTCIQHEKE